MPGEQSPECVFAQENREGFVLGALDRADQERITAHLRQCDSCRVAFADTQRLVDLLPFAGHLDAVPPVRVRGALLDRIRHEQEHPVAVGTVPAPFAESTVAFSTRAPAPSASSVNVLPSPPDPFDPPAPARNDQSFWTKWAAPAFIAPLVIALILVSAWGIGQHNRAAEMERQLAVPAIAANGTTSGGSAMRLYTTRPACADCAGSGQLGADPSKNKAVLLAWDLNPAEKHEVWCVHDDGKSNLVATLQVNANGQVMQNLEFSQPISGYREIRIVRHKDSLPELIIAVSREPESTEGSTRSDLVASN